MMYEVEVRAQDRAGNSTQKTLDIQVTKEKGVLEKAVEPVRQLFGGKKAGQEEMQGKVDSTEKKHGTDEYAAAALAVGLGISGVMWGIRKRKKSRTKTE